MITLLIRSKEVLLCIKSVLKNSLFCFDSKFNQQFRAPQDTNIVFPKYHIKTAGKESRIYFIFFIFLSFFEDGGGVVGIRLTSNSIRTCSIWD